MKKIRIAENVFKTALVPLVGPDDAELTTGHYGESQEVSLSPELSGEIVQINLYASGVVAEDSAGNLLVFDADPTLSHGDAFLDIQSNKMVIAAIAVAAGDWVCSYSTGYVTDLLERPIYFDPQEEIYFAWEHTDATSLNPNAGSQDTLDAYVWYHTCEELA